VAGIESVDVVPGRCEIIDEGQPFPVIVDSASTAESFTRLLVRARARTDDNCIPAQTWCSNI